MAAMQDNPIRFGRPMEREGSGYVGGGELFIFRREGDFERGLLSEKGLNNNYLTFRPSYVFMLVLGEDIFRLNDALFEFRGQAAKHVLFLEGERLREHYAELDKRVEAVRDRLLPLTKCCHKGFDGLYEEALKEIDWSASGDGEPVEGVEEKRVVGEEDGFDVFEAVRQRNAEDGILTDMGREQGFVALQSCPFYGRLVGEIIYTFNDALRRMEHRTGFYVAGGEDELAQRYYAELVKGMRPLRGDLERVIEFCKQKAG